MTALEWESLNWEWEAAFSVDFGQLNAFHIAGAECKFPSMIGMKQRKLVEVDIFRSLGR